MSTRKEVYDAIDSERDYQQRQWPGDSSVGDHILLIEEYAAKARLAWSQAKWPEVEALHVIRKIAGIAVRCMEHNGAFKREN